MKSFLKGVLSLQVSKSVCVGGIATLVDLVALLLLTKSFEISPQLANVPSLTVGAIVQFFGNRQIVFKARDGFLSQQIIGFVSAEIGAFILNAVGFYYLISYTSLSFVLVRPLVSVVVFFGFSYPLWGIVFKQRESLS